MQAHVDSHPSRRNRYASQLRATVARSATALTAKLSNQNGLTAHTSIHGTHINEPRSSDGVRYCSATT